MSTAVIPAHEADAYPRGNSTILRAIAVVMAADIVSKALAAAYLTGRQFFLGGPFRLALLYNDGYATVPLLHVAAIERTAVVVFVLAWVTLRMGGALRRVDRLAPLTLGLLLGAGLANLGDMLIGRPGVVDFIAFDHGDVTTVFNVADVAVGIGLLLCVRTSWLLLASAVAERRAARTKRPAAYREFEVPRVVYVESSADDSGRGRATPLRAPAPADDRRPTAP